MSVNKFVKFFHPLVFFLDKDLQKSAESLNDEYLEYSIKHANQILFDALFYFVGIRNKKAYSYYFSKENRQDSIERWFPQLPPKYRHPTFSYYNSAESRWARKCLDHFEYLVGYLESLILESAYRTRREHCLAEMVDFYKMIPINLTMTTGIRIPYANLKTIIIPWKNLPIQYRKRDIILGYREYYRSLIYDPISQYANVPRDIPEWLFRKTDLVMENIV